MEGSGDGGMKKGGLLLPVTGYRLFCLTALYASINLSTTLPALFLIEFNVPILATPVIFMDQVSAIVLMDGFLSRKTI